MQLADLHGLSVYTRPILSLRSASGFRSSRSIRRSFEPLRQRAEVVA